MSLWSLRTDCTGLAHHHVCLRNACAPYLHCRGRPWNQANSHTGPWCGGRARCCAHTAGMSGCSDAHKNQASRLETEGKSMVIFPEMCFFHIPYRDLVQVLGKKKKNYLMTLRLFQVWNNHHQRKKGPPQKRKKATKFWIAWGQANKLAFFIFSCLFEVSAGAWRTFVEQVNERRK